MFQSKHCFPKLGLFNLNSVTVVCSWRQAHLTLSPFFYNISSFFSCWLHLARINLLADRWASSFRFELGQPNTALFLSFLSHFFSPFSTSYWLHQIASWDHFLFIIFEFWEIKLMRSCLSEMARVLHTNGKVQRKTCFSQIFLLLYNWCFTLPCIHF